MHLKTRAFYCSVIVFFVILTLNAGNIEKVIIPYVPKKLPLHALVVTPDSYQNTSQRFGVIYLLHGYSSDYSLFSKISDLDEYADRYQVIFVCPDGYYRSWYLDSPVDSTMQFAAYIIRTVIPYVDSLYKTKQEKARALLGTSMGGHGALTLLARYPDMFIGGISISGILDLTAFAHKWDIEQVLGVYQHNREVWERNSFITLMDTLVHKNKFIVIDCGKQDFALQINRSAHKKMQQLGIVHHYYERPGNHSYRYVQKVLPDHIAALVKEMGKH